MGLARLGSISGTGRATCSSPSRPPTPAWDPKAKLFTAPFLANDDLDPIFEATVQATEEAIVNALVAAETMVGIDGHTAIGLPHDRLKAALAKYRKLVEAP